MIIGFRLPRLYQLRVKTRASTFRFTTISPAPSPHTALSKVSSRCSRIDLSFTKETRALDKTSSHPSPAFDSRLWRILPYARPNVGEEVRFLPAGPACPDISQDATSITVPKRHPKNVAVGISLNLLEQTASSAYPQSHSRWGNRSVSLGPDILRLQHFLWDDPTTAVGILTYQVLDNSAHGVYLSYGARVERIA